MGRGEQRRDEGIARVASPNADLLQWAYARAMALPVGKRFLVEDLRRRCPITATHPNAWGAAGNRLVRSGHFRQVGWTKAKADRSNARRMPVYIRVADDDYG